MRKHVLFVTGPMAGHGGEESVLRTVLDQLSGDYKLSVLLTEQTGNVEWLTEAQPYLVNLVAMPKFQSRYLKAIKTIGHIRRMKPDVIIALSPRMVFLASLATKGKKVQIFSWLHFSPNQKYTERTLRLLNRADMNLVLTNAMRKQLLGHKINDNRIAVVYNPVARSEQNIGGTRLGEATQLVCMARIQYAGQKNLQELFRGLAGVHGEWQLHLYGSDDSPNQEETLRCLQLLRELDIENKVVWHGFVKDAWSTISTADCLVLTSTLEGLPMVLCEAASRGVPLLSSDCETGPDEIVTSENGQLYHLGDIKQLRDDLQSVVDHRVQYNPVKIKCSVETFYTDNYMKRLKRIIEGQEWK